MLPIVLYMFKRVQIIVRIFMIRRKETGFTLIQCNMLTCVKYNDNYVILLQHLPNFINIPGLEVHPFYINEVIFSSHQIVQTAYFDMDLKIILTLSIAVVAMPLVNSQGMLSPFYAGL